MCLVRLILFSCQSSLFVGGDLTLGCLIHHRVGFNTCVYCKHMLSVCKSGGGSVGRSVQHEAGRARIAQRALGKWVSGARRIHGAATTYTRAYVQHGNHTNTPQKLSLGSYNKLLCLLCFAIEYKVFIVFKCL